jgi:hypothetical protein
VAQAQAVQARLGQQDGVGLAALQLGQAGVDIAAQHDDLEVGPHVQGLGLATQRGGAQARALGQVFQPLGDMADEGVAGSSRSGVAASTRPGGSSAGMSFSEWMAQSMRPSSRASSISLVNRPLPPISIRRRSWMRSPVVTIGISWAKASIFRLAAPRNAERGGDAGLHQAGLGQRQLGAARADADGVAGTRSERYLRRREAFAATGAAGTPQPDDAPLRSRPSPSSAWRPAATRPPRRSCAGTRTGRVEVLSSIVGTQFEQHAPFGGVVPEIAARAHVEAIDAVAAEAMRAAGIGFDALDGVAATAGPGLVGGVMVGLAFGKAVALARGLPLVAVNHLEGHAVSARLGADIAYPFLLLLVSGGHCQLLEVAGVGACKRLGTTIDDAAGEAFDKIAKSLGLPYPGGPALEKLAIGGDATSSTCPAPCWAARTATSRSRA